MMNERIIF